jgi:3-deoxy-manno-octulosonate cytidylyltransferase (CMP-KDO synthetase)
MIEHVYRRAAAARGVDAAVVATDDARIALTVERFGGIVRMTRSIHRSGTDRIAEVASELTCDIIVNVQGDEPLIDQEMIAQVIDPLERDPSIQMSTLRQRITRTADYADPNVVKVVTDQDGNALYFSRSPIPFVRSPGTVTPGSMPHVGMPAWKHVGIYGYRREFVRTFASLPQTTLEVTESLEQLRALEHGYQIRTVETQYDSIGVDTPEDLDRVRQLLAAPTRA